MRGKKTEQRGKEIKWWKKNPPIAEHLIQIMLLFTEEKSHVTNVVLLCNIFTHVYFKYSLKHTLN